MIRRFLAIAVVAAALLTAGACDDGDNITGPMPTLTPTPPGTGTTPTPTPPQSANRVVDVGPGNGNSFVDRVSGTSTSTIGVGDTVEWIWITGIHSTTSGTCTAGCTPDGIWDSGSGTGMTFTRTFTQAGTFPYFCTVHGSMMQGTVVVQ